MQVKGSNDDNNNNNSKWYDIKKWFTPRDDNMKYIEITKHKKVERSFTSHTSIIHIVYHTKELKKGWYNELLMYWFKSIH